MNRHVLKFCFTLLSYVSMAQTNDVFEFQPVRLYDTITTQKAFNTIKEIDKVNDNFFFATEYLKKKGLFLIEKRKKHWIVYDYNDEFGANYVAKKHQHLTNNYVSIDVATFRSGYGINEYNFYIIFDLENNTFLVLHKSSYNADEKNKILSKCESSIKFKQNNLIVKRNCYPKNECGYCIEDGIYKIENGKLKK